jgi:hypothetical protein
MCKNKNQSLTLESVSQVHSVKLLVSFLSGQTFGSVLKWMDFWFLETTSMADSISVVDNMVAKY